jgi:lysophospholipase L1-like esterase
MRTAERYLWLGLLGPLLWLQGKHVRRVTPRLPEPPGARHGVVGQGPLLRLLIAGDSAAAGVGADTVAAAMSGQLLQRLSPHYRLAWRVLASTGLDSPGLHRLLEQTPEHRFDVVVLSVGVNDVTSLRSSADWLRWQNRLAELIGQRFKPVWLIHSAVPPMHAFTALPQPLRWFFGRWAGDFNQQLAASLGSALPDHPKRTLHWPFQQAAPDGLASDGFHPGPLGYAAWAASLSQLILAVHVNAPGESLTATFMPRV